jgi:23S rRNA (cytidine1920-2'-O)/16S rRNA (cytidine1409-2'-O)-methyltransferase
MRADQLLVERKLAPTKSSAQRLIAAGVQWREAVGKSTEWQRVHKNGQELPDWAELALLDNAELRYVSRAGLKLEGALAASGVNPAGLSFLDVGQSTGGFTDCLLQQGATRVVGLDVGHGQLVPALRCDPRVLALEGVNARDPDAVEQALEKGKWPTDAPSFDGLVMDVSFISQTLILPAVLRWVKPGGVLLSLVKPQFELSSAELGKGGVVQGDALLKKARTKVGKALTSLGCEALQWLPSPILGGDGNQEFFVFAKVPAP